MNFLSEDNKSLKKGKEVSIVKTNLRRRIEKTRLAGNNVLITVVEAVVNAIQSIDDRKPSEGRISVLLKRDSNLQLFDTSKRVVGFEVTDNGIGFINANMESFEILDSSYKESIGGRGVGRLQWLKVFENVMIRSVFEDGAFRFLRQFSFNVDHEVVDNGAPLQTSDLVETTISMCNPKEKFRDRFKNCNASQVADLLKEYCLHYFLRNELKPEVLVRDPEMQEEVNVGSLVKEWILKEESEMIRVRDEEFELRHLTLKDSKQMAVAYYGHNRPARIDKLKDLVPELAEGIIQDGEQIGYICRVGGMYLDCHVSETRDAFDIIEGEDESQISQEISMREIAQKVAERIRNYFSSTIDEQEKRVKASVQRYVDNKNPRYRLLLESILTRVSITARDDERVIESKLNQGLRVLENENFDEGQQILETLSKEQELDDVFKKRMEEYAENVERLNGSDLAKYVWRRRIVLEILKMAIEHNADGRFYKEKVVHELLMPQKLTSREVSFDRLNLWVIDERLAFHRYLASDLELSKYPDVDCKSGDRPDIGMIREFDVPYLVSEKDSFILQEINIVEFKRPMRKGLSKPQKEKRPDYQTLEYLSKIRDGIATEKGRNFQPLENAPARIYIVCDLTQDIVQELKISDYQYGGPGMWFVYQRALNAYIEFIGYDRLIDIAKERNYAFFSVLNLPQS